MPIYEYRCTACATQFEELVRGFEAPVACPGCGSADAERLLSTFAGVGGRSSAMPEHPRLVGAAAGGCGGGGCGCGHRH
jgi:putative FmdB family regulatory protein